MMKNSIENLAANFANDQAFDNLQSKWREMVEGALKGKIFNDTLVKTSEDGIALGPLFTNAKNTSAIQKPILPHLANRDWHITTQIDHPSIDHSNKDMLADLEGGASSISLNIDPNGECGIAVRNITDLQRLFSGVYTNLVPLQTVPNTYEQCALIAAHFQHHKDRETLYLNLSYPHAGGNEAHLLSLTHWVCENAPHWKAVTIDAAAIHERGASPAQELAYMLAKAADILRPMIKAHGIETALGLIDVQLACDQDAHFGIIKFRAARLLWAKLAEAFGAKPQSQTPTLHAVSSVRMLGKADPWANILRLNAACFGAVCGGANSITLLPFTFRNGLATPFARRVSRNLQIMQMEETRLGHVIDPAHGSYMHESLTHELAHKAWSIFQKIEAIGGWEDGFDWFMTEVKSTNMERLRKIKDGETLLVGVNQYVKPDVRKAKTLPHPKIKKRTGKIIQANEFSKAIAQASDGYLLPTGKSV
ncbi:MAG: hypothetical protein JKX72_05595 [Robiginitomaculum sp.]|nr:hypothetical protein [Robiginitomaculum sp.]